jgi:hypothetical protein
VRATEPAASRPPIAARNASPATSEARNAIHVSAWPEVQHTGREHRERRHRDTDEESDRAPEVRAAHESRLRCADGRGRRRFAHDVIFAFCSASVWYLEGHFTSSWSAWNRSFLYWPIATIDVAWSKLPGIVPAVLDRHHLAARVLEMELENCSSFFIT